MKEIEKFKETVLKEYPRLTENDSFTFACHPGVPCFNNCCHDVNIFLTPYDIIRLKQALGIRSEELLSKYTISPFDKDLRYPVVMLKMTEDEAKKCPFVRTEGCSVYGDRPWACRMYPLGMASPKEAENADSEFYFLLKESVCKGFGETTRQTVSDWLKHQGIDEYNEMGREFKELTLHDYFKEGEPLTPQKIEMFFMACYNLDGFRDFLFGSSFFDKFEVDDATQERLRSDDLELLGFGYRWLRFALFGEKTLTIRSDVLAARKKELEARQKPAAN